MISFDHYKYRSWEKKFKDYKVDIRRLKIKNSWKWILEHEDIDEINKMLSFALKKTDGEVRIFPYPKLLFFAFNICSFDKVKVVILGQDPYQDDEIYNNTVYPQTMGLSFSVPLGCNIPSSLANIFKNMIEYGHLKSKPKHGNLEDWAKQGCLMFNSGLTVQKKNPGKTHLEKWTSITDEIIKRISDEKEFVIFVLWGRPSYNKHKLIDKTKHKIIASSHPSGLSYATTTSFGKAFKDTDHFGLINQYLKEKNLSQIDWTIN